MTEPTIGQRLNPGPRQVRHADLTPPRRRRTWWERAAYVVFAVLIAGFVTECARDMNASNAPGVTGALDPFARQACDQFATLIDDVNDGVANPMEARARVVDIDEKARYSETPGIARASRFMLAAITQDDYAKVESTTNDFADACIEAGWA